jgi:very-short-patch-repair endonuclease
MRRKGDAREHDVAKLATRQHGLVEFQQLIELGLSAEAIQRRLSSGRLHQVHKGVYAVGHLALTRLGQMMAAVLACGPNALLSHWAAAELWGFLPRKRDFIDVVSATNSRRRKGIIPHRGANLDPDRAYRHGIPVTSPSRTLLDIAAVASRKELARAIEAAERSGWLNPREMGKLIARNPRRPGMKALKAELAAYDPIMRRTRSILERDFLRECKRLGVPKPISNEIVEGLEVDMFWPDAKVIVELDSWEFHKTKAAFERDRRRDAWLERRGYRVLRVTYDWLATDPAEVAETVKELRDGQLSVYTSGSIAYSE